MTPSQRINLAIVCSSIAIALGTAEAIAATILSSVERAHRLDLRQRAEIARRRGRTFDTRTPLELIHHLRDQGIDAVGYVSPMEAYIGPAVQNYQDAPFLRLHGQNVIPLGGISGHPTILCNEAGEYVTYDSDEHGFNNPKGLWSAGASDILIVGDSFAHGACVPSDKSFGALLRQRYPKTISVAYMGNGPLVELAALAEYGRFLSPSVVLWCYYEGNDLLDLRNERSSRLLDGYMTDGFTHDLLNVQSQIDSALGKYMERQLVSGPPMRPQQRLGLGTIAGVASHVRLPALRSHFGVVYGTEADPFESELALFQNIVSKAGTRTKAWNGQLYFVYLPAWSRYSNEATESEASGLGRRSRILGLINALHIPVIDLHTAFQAHADPVSLFPLRLRGHYTEQGHALVAAEILKAIGARATPPADAVESKSRHDGR